MLAATLCLQTGLKELPTRVGILGFCFLPHHIFLQSYKVPRLGSRVARYFDVTFEFEVPGGLTKHLLLKHGLADYGKSDRNS